MINRLFFIAGFLLVSNFSQAQQLELTASKELKIMSWNIFMRPIALFKDGQIERTHAIVNQLRSKDYDIIVFEEAFMQKIRDIIWNGLQDLYPYQLGPGQRSLFRTNSGVWLLSKLPFLKTDSITFKNCKAGDCFARKGAFLVEVVKDGQTFQLVGAHLQAEDGEKYQKVREKQYAQIKKELLDKHRRDGVTQLLAGDLNTPKEMKDGYSNMLSSLDMKDGITHGPQGLKYSWAGKLNDLIGSDYQGKGQLLDYILIDKRKNPIVKVVRKLKIMQHLWSERHKDLSDHYAIDAVIKF